MVTMTADKLKSIFAFYGSYLRTRFRGVTPAQMGDVSAKLRTPTLANQMTEGHLLFMTEEGARFVDDGRVEKAMRWLGFLQGVFWERGYFSLDDLKNHSRPGEPGSGWREKVELGIEGRVTLDPAGVGRLVLTNRSGDPITDCRLIFDVEMARRLMVVDVRVGVSAQLSGGAIPAELFTRASRRQLELEPLSPSCAVVVTVRNRIREEICPVVATVEGRRATDLDLRLARERRRVSAVGLGDRTVEPRSDIKIVVEIRETIELSTLVLPSGVCESFEVLSVSVGREVRWSPSDGRASCGGRVFRESEDHPLMWEGGLRVAPGSLVAVHLRNISDEARWFGGALVGTLA